MTTFTAQVSDWVKASQARMDAIRKESVQRVTREILNPVGKGGRLRFDTGFLRSSFMGSTSAMPQATRPHPGSGSFDFDESAYALVLAGWQPEQTFHGGFTANYAGAREYGTRGQAPDRMVGLPVQRWQDIVEEVTREARRRANG